MLTQLLTETLLGALTGYITNDTAIRSLFKPNGVIEETRDDFAREAGKLLESQVLTQSVLARQLMLPEVQEALAQALEDFLRNELPHALGTKTIQDLPAHDKMLARVQQILLQFAQSERETMLHNLKKYFPTEELFTQLQCKKLADTLEQVLLALFREQQFAETIWQSWYREKGGCTPEVLGLSAICRTAAANLGVYSAGWLEELQSQYGEQMKAAALESVQKLHLEAVLLELDAQMERYTLRQYLNGSAEELSDGLYRLLHAEQGQELLERVVEEVLHALETVDVPLSQIIPADLLAAVMQPLQEQLPFMIEEVLEWVWQNKQSVQHMLEEAVDEVAVEAGGMKGALLQQLKDTLLGELMQSSDIYGMLVDVLSGEGSKEQSVNWLMEKLTALLTDNTVGQLVTQLNENGKLQIMAYRFLYENLERYLSKSDTALLESLLDLSPGSLHLAQKQAQIEQLLVHVLLTSLYHVDLAQMITDGCESLLVMPVDTILPNKPDAAIQIMKDAVHAACTYAIDSLPQIRTDALYSALYDAALWWLEEQHTDTMAAFATKWPLADGMRFAADALADEKTSLTDGISKAGLQLMQGRLSILAQQQIQSLSSADMLELVEDFMGRELQPLNYLGAGMGAIAGATVGTALSTAIPAVSVTNPALAAGVLAGKAAVFGAVGYTTNCAAVKGLFWPYEPVGGVRTLQGVIPKQKERFAGSMGRLVDRYVINDTILKEQITLLADTIEAKSLSAVLADNEALFDRIFAELALKRHDIAAPVCEMLLEKGSANSRELLSGTGTKQLSFLQDTVLFETDADMKSFYLLLSAWLTEAIHKDVPLDAIVDANTLWQWVETFVSGSTLPDLAGMLQESLRSEKTLKSLAGGHTESTETIAAIEIMVQDWIAAFMRSTDGQETLSDGIAGKLDGEKLYRWLAGNSTPWVKDNLTMLFHWVESLILELLQSRQNTLTAAVEQALLNRMGLMMQMGYAMMNGGEIVAAIVDRLVHQKIPIFLSVKRKELEMLLGTMWEKQLAPIVLEAASQYFNADTAAYTKQALKTLLAQPALQRCVQNISVHVMHLLEHTPVVHWGQYVNVSAVLARPQMQLGFQWQTHNKEILASWQEPLQAFCADKLHTLTLARLSRGYTEQLPVQAILSGNGTDAAIADLFAGMEDQLATTALQDWVDWDAWCQILSKDIAALCRDTAFREWLGYEAELLVLALAAEPDSILPAACRKALLDSAISAGLATAETHGTVILGKMQLSALAEEQLKQMDSAHLEVVVRGFAEQYLVHIQNRGWLGAVFALPGMLVYLI